ISCSLTSVFRLSYAYPTYILTLSLHDALPIFKTRHFLGCISSTLPTAFNGISCGVGFIKSICKDPVTKRGGATFSDGSCPFFRCNANEADPVPWQSIKDASNPP